MVSHKIFKSGQSLHRCILYNTYLLTRETSKQAGTTSKKKKNKKSVYVHLSPSVCVCIYVSNR